MHTVDSVQYTVSASSKNTLYPTITQPEVAFDHNTSASQHGWQPSCGGKPCYGERDTNDFMLPQIIENSQVQSMTPIDGTDDYYYTFTDTGDFNHIRFYQDTVIDILLVGGGGAGAYGGGGGGGIVYMTSTTYEAGFYDVKVGRGGEYSEAKVNLRHLLNLNPFAVLRHFESDF